MSCTLVGLTAALVAAPARGAGFSIYEQGAAAMGRACAFAAVADTPSALFYNPAGLALQPGLGVEIGDTLIFPMGSHTEPGPGGATTDAVANVFYPPALYASYLFPGDVAIGLGAFAPYGLGMEWPEGWAGFEEVEEIELQTIFLNPTVAWRPVPWLAIAAGFDAVLGTVELRKGLNFVDERGSLHAAGSAWGFGGNAGVLVTILDGRLSFGASYRSAVKLAFAGDADFTVPLAFAHTLEDQPLESSVTLPHVVILGIAGVPTEIVSLSLDVTVTTWSTFGEFGLAFPEDAAKPEEDRLTRYEPRNWADEFAIRAGVEVRPPVEGLALRAGLVYDRTPAPSNTLSPSLPDSDRIDVAIGAGYAFDFGLALDLAYMYVQFLPRSSSPDAFPGDYEASAHLLGLSLGYRWAG